MMYAAQKLNAKRTERAIKRAKTAKRKPDPFKLGFIAAANVLASGRGKHEVKRIAKRYRSQLGIEPAPECPHGVEDPSDCSLCALGEDPR